MKGKRKPNLLSLDTGAANNSSRPGSLASPGIPSMLQRRGLDRSASTPRMITTPMYGPVGGMTLWPQLVGPSRLGAKKPLQDNTSNYNAIAENNSEASTGVQMATLLPGVTVGGDAFDRAHSSEDTSSSSYPNGPILMYEPNIYLYSEPKFEEILNFDVVINVAREVKCPTEIDEIISQGTQRLIDVPIIRLDRAKSDSGLKNITTKSLISIPLEKYQSAKSSKQTHMLEYIHVPWDHNTDVKDELWDLCQLIESRSKIGKRILVHCQQGASRSATLIIAYGMYTNHDIGPNESYQIVQSKSPWVNPNMSLLFSLNDFKKVINENKYAINARTSNNACKSSAPALIDTLSSNTSEARNISYKQTSDPIKFKLETYMGHAWVIA
ncbi:Tyrosine-protein phosphatase pmp1 [Erysiphe necator]|uniref:protein-tyrosine-phosphatase n=1 Tax=Uncinula necator TaxID=52586 RepID=A0A0B1PBE8_UNCNE|nr:Tyrosine-protein phosphatase pmp1 [Erysiphe necator]KHJ33984.1 putative dual specificity phosphatase [Erysiphe necator]